MFNLGNKTHLEKCHLWFNAMHDWFLSWSIQIRHQLNGCNVSLFAIIDFSVVFPKSAFMWWDINERACHVILDPTMKRYTARHPQVWRFVHTWNLWNTLLNSRAQNASSIWWKKFPTGRLFGVPDEIRTVVNQNTPPSYWTDNSWHILRP